MWNWRGTNGSGGKVALPDWESVALNGRDVRIVFDSDVTAKPEVRAALRRLSEFLVSRKAQVRTLYLPSGPGGIKVGLDDFLAAGHSVDDLLGLAGEDPPKSEAGEELACPYEATAVGLLWNKPTGDGSVPVQLTNFTASIVSDIERDDGAEVTRAFEIEARLGARAARFTIPSARFGGMNWPTEHLGAEAVIFPGQSTRDHTRVAVQLLSGSVPRRRVYTHTGWRVIDGVHVYLHGGGAIGPSGLISDLNVELPPSLSPFRFDAPPEHDELQEAVDLSLCLEQLAPDPISIPILAAVYRSVLGDVDSALHLTGPTGGGKSELAARAMQHFGGGFDRLHLPAAWSSTGNALEALAFVAKDALFVVDDFCPTGSSNDVQRLHREADRLLRAQGNRSGRGRLAADGTLRLTRPPRGFTLSTGEEIPRGHSLRARMLVIDVGPRDVDFPTLSMAQAAGAQGAYARSMAGFLKWLAPRYEGLQQTMPADLARIRAGASGQGQHRRTSGIVAELYFGFRTFLAFAVEIGVRTSSESEQLLQRAWTALCTAAADQAAHQATAEPTERFFDLLRSALGSGEAHIATTDGGTPDSPGAWGWRERVMERGLESSREWLAQGRRVGWIEGDDLFLDRDAAHRACQNAAGAGGEGLVIGAVTLTKRLDQRGLLASTESGRSSLLVRRSIEGSRRSVLHVLAATVCPRPDAPGPSTSSDPGVQGDRTGPPGPVGRGDHEEVAQDEAGLGKSVGKLGSDVQGVAQCI